MCRVSLAATSGDVIARPPAIGYPGFEVDNIKDWLTRCLQHDHCQLDNSGKGRLDPYEAHLPTRCINVGTPENPTLFFEETGSATGKFLTRSHRWSAATGACSTTSDNYQQRLSNLDIEPLPRLFQEAVQMSRRLKVKHLWIDSICIIQSGDNYRDWKLEAAKIADYYQHSLITLSAPSGDHLFPSSSRFSQRLVPLPYRERNSDHSNGFFFVFKLEPLNHEYQSLVQDSELLTRAWVFQEYLLSRRIIHFTSLRLILECQSSLPETTLGETVMELQRDGSRTTVATKKRFHQDPKVASIYNRYEVVEAYSGLHFTYPGKDRTVALSGFATEFKNTFSPGSRGYNSVKVGSKAHVRPVDYLEGLWVDHAHVGLLWEIAQVGCHKRLNGRPSWSWTREYTQVLWNLPREGVPWAVRELNDFQHRAASFDMSPRPTYPAYTSLRQQSSHSESGVATLMLKAKMQKLLVDRPLKTEEVKLLYEHKLRPRSIDNYCRALRNMSKNHKLCGWASFDLEEPRNILPPAANETAVASSSTAEPNNELSYPVSALEGTEVCALHISTLKHLDRGFAYGYFFTLPSAFYVLFVRNVRDNVYERIGMGCLFGAEVDQAFKQSEAEEIVLV